MAIWPGKHKPLFDRNSDAGNGVLVVGDSHCRGFQSHPLFGPFQDQNGVERLVYCHKIKGGSMTGFGRRNSSLGLRSNTHKLVKNYKKYCSHTVYAFGQVDVELGLYYRFVQNDGAFDPTDLFVEIIDKYIENILSFRTKTTPLIKGINDTVLEDQKSSLLYVSRVLNENNLSTGVNDASYQRLVSIYPEYAARQKISTDFNRHLKSAAQKSGIRYFDINDQLRDPQTGKIHYNYRPAGQDHHLVDSLAIRKLHLDSLARAITQDI